MIRRSTEYFACLAIVALPVTLLTGCESGSEPTPQQPEGGAGKTAKKPAPAKNPGESQETKKQEEPKYITVQHILIGFKGSLRGKPITRSREEAAQMAKGLLERAKGGEDFGALVKEYTDDSFPGIYKMANKGVPTTSGVYSRTRMVPAFGDVGFPLAVGETGMASHDPRKSPYGWHVIKRLE